MCHLNPWPLIKMYMSPKVDNNLKNKKNTWIKNKVQYIGCWQKKEVNWLKIGVHFIQIINLILI